MNVCIDTRVLKPGDVFIPIKGPQFDGHDFIDEAIRKGASQILDVDIGAYARQYRKKLRCSVIAITGSAGKTTAKELLSAVLSVKYRVVSNFKNFNNEIGVPFTVLQADGQTDILIVEMGMRGRGEIAELTQIARPTHSVVTNIGWSHVERLRTQRNIALAKSEIFRVPLKWETSDRFAYVMHGTPYYDLLAKRAQGVGYKLFPYGGQTRPDEVVNLCYLIGQHFGLTPTEIGLGIARYKSIDHRLAVSSLREGVLIDDTYNANPDGYEYAFQVMGQYRGRRIVVMGDMLELGDHSDRLHQWVADQARNYGVSHVITYGDYSQRVRTPLRFAHAHQLSDIVPHLQAVYQPGDVILIKGSRGLALETVVSACVSLWA